MSDTQKNKKPNVPNLRFPGFEGEWESRKIGEDCSVLMCKRIFANQTADQGDVPFYKIGTIGAEPDAYIPRELFEEYKAKYNYPRKGEVMVTCAGTVGKTIVFDGADSYYQDSNIVWLSNPKQLYINSFLNYFLSRVNWNKLNSTTITRIYNDNLRELVIKYPSVKEQEKIVSLLSLLDQRIAVQSKVFEDLKKLKAALCTSLFSQGRTISVALSDIGESFSTMNLSKEDLTYSGVECILYGELFTTYGRVIKDVKSHTSIETNGESTTSGLNDLLFPASTTVDAISLIAPSAISKTGVILGGDMFGIRLNAKYNNRYMSNLLYHCYRRELASYAQGSTIIHIHYRDIERIKITVHPKNIQDCIADILDLLDSRIENEQNTAAAYACQKAYLIGRLFI